MPDWNQLVERPTPSLGMRALSGLYALGWEAYLGWYRLGMKKRRKPPCIVIGVGNLTVGGTGKTPFVIALGKALSERGMKIAVSCSGYGGGRWQEITLLDPTKTMPPEEIGEEPLLIRNALPCAPIVVGKKRFPAVSAAFERWKPEIILLDDGFQHLPLARNLDLVLMDARRPLGNGFTLPAGTLREPISGLNRAAAVVLVSQEEQQAETEPISEIKRANPSLPVFHARRKPTGLRDARSGNVESIKRLNGSGIIAFSAIGNPANFEAMLERQGAVLLETIRLPDHHAYSEADLKRAEAAARSKNAFLVTTEKDYVKLRPFIDSGGLPLFVLEMEMELEEAMIEWIILSSGWKQSSSE